jgi:hypothetical protein
MLVEVSGERMTSRSFAPAIGIALLLHGAPVGDGAPPRERERIVAWLNNTDWTDEDYKRVPTELLRFARQTDNYETEEYVAHCEAVRALAELRSREAIPYFVYTVDYPREQKGREGSLLKGLSWYPHAEALQAIGADCIPEIIACLRASRVDDVPEITIVLYRDIISGIVLVRREIIEILEHEIRRLERRPDRGGDGRTNLERLLSRLGK